MVITLKTCEKTRNMMLEFYEEMRREKTPQYALFQADDGETVVTLYESGKAVFQGKDADLASDYWIETEKINSGKAIVTNSEDKSKKTLTSEKKEVKGSFHNVNSVGSDEVGTGDYFGPLVVTASYVSKENIPYLEGLGVRDSKKITDDKIKEIAPDLIKKIPHTTIVLSNKEYNSYHSTDTNMNKIKAILHNKCLLSVIKKENVSYKYIVVDQFENEKSYYAHLKEVPEKVKNIKFITKAEDQCLSVAASSIISRYIFLKEMKSLGEKFGIIMPLGASNMVDEVGANLVKKHGKKILEEIAKLSFKNTEKILELAKK